MACLWRPREEALTARLNLGAAGTQQLGTLEVRLPSSGWGAMH